MNYIKKILLYFIMLFSFILGGSFLVHSENNFQIFKDAKPIGSVLPPPQNTSPAGRGLITGKACANASRRPFAVMLAGDPQARPLSGIADADMVVEIPVIVNDITRYAAFYQCGQPREIGSIRSARGPFIGIAKGYDAIFAHWGGEKDALLQLQSNVINNIDALINPFDAFWRKPGIPMPHDGFTSYEKLKKSATQLGYQLEKKDEKFFVFKKNASTQHISSPHSIVSIRYPGKFSVSYHYSPESNSYLRSKGGTPEQDSLTKKQIEVKNVLIVWANIYHTYSQYDNVEIDGKEGRLRAFIDGGDIDGTWRKEAFDKPLLFFNSEGSPLEFQPGNTWIEVLGSDQKVETLTLK